MKERVISLVLILYFILSVSIIILGQKNISAAGFIEELIGLFGLLLVLFIYNKKYR